MQRVHMIMKQTLFPFANYFLYFQSGASGMGCGSSYDNRTADPPGQAPPAPALHCDMCAAKFSFISRKRSCSECGNVFCSACLPSERGAGSGKRTCARCGVLNKRPPHRGELMKLRVKDLQHFLTRKRINIKSCVGKLRHTIVVSPHHTLLLPRTIVKLVLLVLDFQVY